MRKYLSTWFDVRQLRLIESAFEENDVFGHGERYSSDIQNAVYFGNQYDDDNDRLEAIFQNIVANDGRFVPPPAPEYY
jgi:hypothetical protein